MIKNMKNVPSPAGGQRRDRLINYKSVVMIRSGCVCSAGGYVIRRELIFIGIFANEVDRAFLHSYRIYFLL